MTDERYSPTRTEWLVLNMQAKAPMLLSQMRMLRNDKSVDDVRVFFKSKEPDTVVAVVRHLKSVSPDVVKLLNEEIKREVGELAEYHGWRDKVKTEFDVG
jgi:hypothetical protein